MSRSTTQLARQQRCRAVRMASIADRPDRYPYESAWNLGSSSGSRYRRTTSWAMRSATVGIPSGRVPAFTFLKASQTSRFEMSNGFALVMRLLPSLVGRLPRQDTAAPSVQPHYRTFSPTADSSVPVPCIGQLILIGATDLNVSLHIKTTGSHVPCKSLSRSHAAFEPDVAWAGLQVSAQACPEMTT